MCEPKERYPLSRTGDIFPKWITMIHVCCFRNQLQFSFKPTIILFSTIMGGLQQLNLMILKRLFKIKNVNIYISPVCWTKSLTCYLISEVVVSSVHIMLRVLLLLLLLLLLLRQVFTSSQSQICLSVRFGFVHFFICIQ